VGLLNAVFWTADILHFYGIYLVFAAFIFHHPTKWLLRATPIPMFLFIILWFFLDFDQGWECTSGEYLDFWTMPGMVRHIFYNGFYPVFPWISFFIAGMWMARQNLSDKSVRKKLLMVSLLLIALSENMSLLLVHIASRSAADVALFDLLTGFVIDPWNPMPLFVASAGGCAAALILVCLGFSSSFFQNSVVRSMTSVGQMAFTLYVAHVFWGNLVLDLLNAFGIRPYFFSLWGAACFYCTALVLSNQWLAHFGRGPLEFVMRRFSGDQRYFRPGEKDQVGRGSNFKLMFPIRGQIQKD
jgi:uncharacterized membrane protein YeiB